LWHPYALLKAPCELTSILPFGVRSLLIIALCWGGQEYSWSSAHVLAPLIIGVFGLAAWFFRDARELDDRHWIPYDTHSRHLILVSVLLVSHLSLIEHDSRTDATSRTSWPVYFQAVKGASPVRSAVDFFSVAFITAPFAMVAGGSIGALQVYKPQNVIAWSEFRRLSYAERALIISTTQSS
jgi:hypothetical protein